MTELKENKYQAHCPRCDGQRACDVLGEFVDRWGWTDGAHEQNGIDHHRLLRCRGCEIIFYHLEQSNSEEWDGRIDPHTGEEEIYYPVSTTTYPTPDRPGTKPDWVWQLRAVDLHLSAVMEEIYSACEKDLLVLASTGLRTAFDRATEILKIDPASSFKEKLDELEKAGAVGRAEADSLSVLVDAGNAAAHRAWRPSPEQFAILVAALEQFIFRCFLMKNTAEVFVKIPPKPSRSKK